MDAFMEADDTRLVIKNKLRKYFDGRIVRKDLTKHIKEGANVPVYVLEFLLGQYCSSDEDDVIEQGVNNVKRILTGEATKWSDINEGSKLGEIWVCFDNKRSSTVSFCVDSILGGKTIDNPNIFAAKTSKEVIDYVERTPNAIGIIGSNWLNDKRDSTNTTWNKAIRVMSISKLDKATPMNSWKPYQAWLLNGRYPFVRTIYALLNDPKRGLPWGFAHFIEQPRGQMIVFKAGLLPTRGEIAIRDVNVNNKPY